MPNEVLTGAVALVRVKGQVIGKMRDVTVSEDLQRADVRGLGTIFSQEKPVVAHNGSLSCTYYFIDWATARAKGSIRRDVQTKNEYEDYLVLQEEGIQVDIFRKITDVIDARGIPVPKLKPIAIVKGVYTNNESLNISEGQVSTHNQSFVFTEPIIFPV